MNLRRILIIAGISLVLFLALYTWNRRTEALDDLAANVGLELTAAILRPLESVRSSISGFWERYIDLVDVRDENLRLQERLAALEARLMARGEDMAELERLRVLVQFPVDARWRPLAARVLAGRLGPNAVLDSITISRGYLNGGRPGIPLVTNLGLVGRVLRSSPHASTVLLVTDPDSRVAVLGQESRAPGILKGRGMGNEMEVDFVQRDVSLKDGEVLITSGLDDKYPKGLPVARVTRVAPSDYTQFMAVSAAPLVDLQHLEEVLLLEKTGLELPPEEPDHAQTVFVGPPRPAHLQKNISTPAQQTPTRPETAVTGQTTAGSVPAPRPDQHPASPQPEVRSQPRGQEAGAQRSNLAPAQPLQGRQLDNVPRTREGAPVYRVITP